jgi:hypothetical protein
MAPRFDLVIHEPPSPIGDQHYHMMWHQTQSDDPGHRWLREMIRQAIGHEFAKSTPKRARQARPRPVSTGG